MEKNIIMNQIGFDKDELELLKGCFVTEIVDGVDDDGDEFVHITLFDPTNMTYILVEIGGHGLLFISEPCSQSKMKQ